MVSEGIPLEQGLRHLCKQAHARNMDVRGHSIRTRIKTYLSQRGEPHQLSEGIPLEQGLRPNQRGQPSLHQLSEGIPLEQGLRLDLYRHISSES